MKLNQRLTEEDTKLRRINKTLSDRGWSQTSIRMEYPVKADHYYEIIPGTTKTRRCQRKKKDCRADYVLFRETNRPLAVLEAKSYRYQDSEGIDQAKMYAKALDVPFAYSSSGHGFVEANLLTGTQREILLTQFPTPDELWDMWCEAKGVSREARESLDGASYFTSDEKSPRYYQLVAINKTIEAIFNEHKKRILLVMATGTGKTYTAFQIVWRFREAMREKNPDSSVKVLYLADRNILVDQTLSGDFVPFRGAAAKIRKGKIDNSVEVSFGLYQQLKGPRQCPNGEEDEAELSEENFEEDITEEGAECFVDHYKSVPADYFDLIIVDECHRGSARDESSWREILEYYSSAVQIGMTATPNYKDGSNNIDYFGEPLYTYSLKQGIEDGYLAPYRVIQYNLDKDIEGWEPEEGERDDTGKEIPKRKYTLSDFDRTLILKDRIRTVAELVNQEINKIGEKPKTIIFCTSQDHALRMRDELRRIRPDWMRENGSAIVRITSNDEEGKMKLSAFTAPNETYPIIATTSKLLTTGANTKAVKLIVLDTPIGSMSEFKQIIGRGTRLVEDADKTMFTILDFRKATDKFSDPEFDGEHPIIEGGVRNSVKNLKENSEITFTANEDDPDSKADTPETLTEEMEVKKDVYIKDGIPVDLKSKTEKYLDEDGKLVTAKYMDFSRKQIMEELGEKDNFMELWNSDVKKEVIKHRLEEKGVSIEILKTALANPDLDLFDLICGVAYGSRSLLTREMRASKARSDKFFEQYSGKAREVLEELLSIYARQGILEIDNQNVLKHPDIKQFGEPRVIVSFFGSREKYRQAVLGLERTLYAE